MLFGKVTLAIKINGNIAGKKLNIIGEVSCEGMRRKGERIVNEKERKQVCLMSGEGKAN